MVTISHIAYSDVKSDKKTSYVVMYSWHKIMSCSICSAQQIIGCHAIYAHFRRMPIVTL
jgi:hypothetical protein